MYPFLRDHLSASHFHDVWLRFLIPTESVTENESLKTRGIYTTLSSPIGLASGIDLDAVAFPKLLGLGLGFIEIGPAAPASEYFDNQYYSISQDDFKVIGPITSFGAVWVKRNLVRNPSGPRGVNLTPTKENIDLVPHYTDEDYTYSISKLYHLVDYFSINLCSNKFKRIGYYKKAARYQGLIKKLVQQRNLEIGLFVANETGLIKETEGYFRRVYTPMYLKINSDWEDIQGLVDCCIENGVDGLIIGDDSEDITKSREALKKASKSSNGRLELISYGGIETGSEVLERIKMGAKLVQLYSILLKKGPKEYFRIHQELLTALSQEGFNSINDAFSHYNKESH